MRLIAHIGAQKTATTYIQHGLYRNQDVLADHGVYLPTTARLELAPRSVGHHHLVWQYTDQERFRPDIGGWDSLRAELARVQPDVALITCEGMAAMAHKHGRGDDLMRELRATEARRHVRVEIPFYTGQAHTVSELTTLWP